MDKNWSCPLRPSKHHESSCKMAKDVVEGSSGMVLVEG